MLYAGCPRWLFRGKDNKIADFYTAPVAFSDFLCYNQGKTFLSEVTMQKILGYMRKAIQEYGLISSGDRILVGISGGKDSLVLMQGLILLRRFIGIDYPSEG